MADVDGRDNTEDSESPSIFDLFEPAPEPDPGTFGKVPVVRGDDEDYDRRSGTTSAERKTAAEAEAAGLQHWTAPATGQVPAILEGEGKESDLWGDVKGPSWQSDDPGWSGPDLADVFAGSDQTDLEEGADAEPTPSRPASSSRRSELDDWGPDGRPAPPTDTSEGRRIPGTEPPARLDTTEISGLDRGVGASRDTVEQAADSVGQRHLSLPDSQRPSTSSAVTTPKSSVTLERQPDALESPDITSASPDDPLNTRRRFRPTAAGSRAPDLPAPLHPPEHFSAADPTAPGLFADDGPGDQYFGDGGQHDDDFLDVERPGGRNLPQAVATGLVLAALVLAALWVGAGATMVVVTAAAVLAAIELYNAMRLAGLRPAALLGLLATAALPVAAFFRGDAAFTLIVALMVVFGTLWYLAGADTERPVLNLSLTMLGVCWIGGLAAFAALILRNDEHGIPLLLSAIVLAVASDIMAYFGGRALGRRPFHSASPNKTWEGTMTGFVFTVFVAFAMAVMPFTTMWDGRFLSALLLGAVVGILTPMGDLAESLVKRDLGVKDMGTIVPGHGGILDRVDGLLFALPGAYYVALLAGII